jgi:signal transduction histidine kinase
VELDLRPAEGRWDRKALAQMVDHLLSNAFKFGAGKPVRISVGAAGRSGVLVVRDEGIGIAAADQARIFGPFERAVSERNYAGFGIGLWAVRRIVEAHGGSVEVESAEGRGAAFTVRLPTSPEEIV